MSYGATVTLAISMGLVDIEVPIICPGKWNIIIAFVRIMTEIHREGIMLKI